MEDTVYQVCLYLYGATQKAHDMLRRAKDSYPRHRSKAVVCPVTGEETLNPSGLSSDAWQLIHAGVKAKEHEQAHAGETEPYYARSGWLSEFARRPARITGNESHIRLEFVQLIRALTQQDRNPQGRWSSDHRLESEPRDGNYYERLDLTPQQAEAVRSFGKALEWLLEQKTEDSYREGSALLTRLATGDISMDELNAVHDRREKV